MRSFFCLTLEPTSESRLIVKEAKRSRKRTGKRYKPCTKHRCIMLFVYTRKTWILVAMVTVGVVIATLVGCQFARAAHARTPASPSGYHQSPLPHTTAALACLAATLLTAIALAPWSLGVPYATDRFVRLQAFACSLCLPP